MSVARDMHDEMDRLLWAFRDGVLAEADALRLGALVRDDAGAREKFLRYAFLCGSLAWNYGVRREDLPPSAAYGWQASERQKPAQESAGNHVLGIRVAGGPTCVPFASLRLGR